MAYIYEMLYTSPTFHKPTDTIRDIYHPLFDKHHVSLVLQAHSHNYQKTYPIKYNDKDDSNPVITIKNEGEYNNTDGTIFAVVGYCWCRSSQFYWTSTVRGQTVSEVWFLGCQHNG